MTEGGAAKVALAPIAVTMGEPAGIGGDIALLAWRHRSETLPPFFVIDDPRRLAALSARMGLGVAVEAIESPSAAGPAFDRALPVLPEQLAVEIAPGKPRGEAAASVLRSIDRAIDLVRAGRAAAMVTNPIHKATMYAAGFTCPGHTEYLGGKAGVTGAPVMMLASSALRVIPVTIHLPLRRAIEALSTDAIVHCGRVAAAALERDFGIASPRLAVAGLNPHAGEEGHLGLEDGMVVAPAVTRLREEGIDAAGPFPADTLFHAAARAGYDVALCMYHDQALIPIKTIDFDGGVNVTLGLPFIRTSPDHGTAFDVAGTGAARPDSLMAALRLARDMAVHRSKYARRTVA